MKRQTWWMTTLAIAVGTSTVSMTGAQAAPGEPAKDAPGEVPKPEITLPKAPAAETGRVESLRRELEPRRPEFDTARRQRQESVLRTLMNRQGIEEKATQDAIIAHLAEQEQAYQTLLETGSKMMPAVMSRDGMTEAQIRTLMNDYQVAVEEYRENRKKAEAALEAQIAYSKNPRLQALLLLSGAIGDGPSLLLMVGMPGGFGGPGALADPRAFDAFGGGPGIGGPGGPFGPGIPGMANLGPNDPISRMQANELIVALRREFAQEIADLRAQIRSLKAAPAGHGAGLPEAAGSAKSSGEGSGKDVGKGGGKADGSGF